MDCKKEYEKLLKLTNETDVESRYEYLSRLKIYFKLTGRCLSLSKIIYTDKDIEELCSSIWLCSMYQDENCQNMIDAVISEMGHSKVKIKTDRDTVFNLYRKKQSSWMY